MRNSSVRQATAWTLALVVLILGAGIVSAQTVDAEKDAGITAKVEARLARDKEVSTYEILVATVDGVVTLQGEVDDKATKTKAGMIAFETRGVREVQNRIQIPAADGS